ncbi:sensor histidine kinase [Tenacibaculum sp. TC6]|uniref:sensor histidine kinase n=1 Tax=Tenacibaculum sp. TC6 TaxID=3423223 RepID=UPI003D359C66
MYFWSMTHPILKNKKEIIKGIVILSLIIPIVWLTYEILYLGKESVVFLANTPGVISLFILIYYLAIMIYGIVWLLIQLKSIISIKKELKESELLHLKSQVNPHFFFNMLNGLYSFIEKDPKKARQLVLKLSDLMRYGIYESDKTSVSIEEEITYLQNYIELHKMRYYKDIDVKFTTSLDKKEYQVMPLLFINLVENAFKHGIENLREKAYVYMKLNTNNGVVKFDIENNFDKEVEGNKEGIGLKNLKRRLELTYPKKHSLTFNKEEGIFKAQLILNV